MRKTIAVIVASLALALGVLPAWAGDYSQPDPTVHLTAADMPDCYRVGRAIDTTCLDAVTCDAADSTCNWFCSGDNGAFTVDCAYIDDPRVRTWANILYGIIDRYRNRAEHSEGVANAQASRIEHLLAVNRHLHKKIKRLRTKVHHLR